MEVTVRHTKWQKFMLPSTAIEDAVKNQDGQLMLKITCRSCGAKSGPFPVLYFAPDTRVRLRERKLDSEDVEREAALLTRRQVRENTRKLRMNSRRNRESTPRTSSLRRKPDRRFYEKRKPYLRVVVGGKRTKRSIEHLLRTGAVIGSTDAGTCASEEFSDVMACTRDSLTLNFTAIGWEFVISPQVVEDFGFCSGTCSQEAHFLSARERVKRDDRVCCQATHTRPIMFEYIDDTGAYRRTRIEHFFTDQCACF